MFEQVYTADIQRRAGEILLNKKDHLKKLEVAIGNEHYVLYWEFRLNTIDMFVKNGNLVEYRHFNGSESKKGIIFTSELNEQIFKTN